MNYNPFRLRILLFWWLLTIFDSSAKEDFKQSVLKLTMSEIKLIDELDENL